MFELLTLLGLAVLVFLLAKRVAEKRGRKRTPSKPRAVASIEAWLRSEVASMIAGKFAQAGTSGGLPYGETEIARAFGGDPDPEVVTSVEGAVRDVELVWARVPGTTAKLGSLGTIELRAEVRFEDGGVSRAVRAVESGEIPADVRDALEKSGASQVHRSWAMPWSNA